VVIVRRAGKNSFFFLIRILFIRSSLVAFYITNKAFPHLLVEFILTSHFLLLICLDGSKARVVVENDSSHR
jgi:hypothetical protein